MSMWHSKELGDGIDAFGPSGAIQNAYVALILTTKLPADFAVFSYYDLRANMVTVYFSPSALQLAKSFGATPCEKPVNKEGFGLLVGDQRARSELFGD